MASTNNVKILCRHGGDFVEASDKICYKGGKNYIVHVDRDINYDNLSTEVRKKCKLIDITSIQYQYPGRDLDSLVSIEDDDDVSTMMMEFPQSDMVIDLFVFGAQHFSALVATASSEPVVHAPEDLNGSNGIDVHFRPAIESNTGDIQNIQNDWHEMECNEVDGVQNLDNGASGAALMSFPDISNFNKGNGFHEMDVGNLLNSNNGPIGVAPEELNRNKETSVHITNMDTGDVRSVPNESNQKDCNEMDNAVSLPCLNVDKGANDIKEGQEYENESAFRKALRNHAICSNFEYKRTRSGHGVFKARCFDPGCSWSINACETPGKHTFKVKTLEGNHTCDTSERIRKHKHANEKWIADLVTDQKLVHRSPNEIVDAINTDYGIKVSYHKARRGKRLAAERDAGFEQSTAGHKHRRQKPLAAERDADFEQSIKDVLEGIESTNPGSRTNLSRSSDKSLRIFVAYKASIYGFSHGCRPLLILDAIKIEKHAIVYLHAAAVDAEDEMFPVAYAFVESKCRENWKWFCEELAHILVLEGKIPELTFMSDPKERILEEVVRDFFPDSPHRYPLGRLLQIIHEKFESREITNLVDGAARAYTQNEFDAKLSALREKSEEAWKFMKGMEPKNWALSHHQGSCRFIGSFLYTTWMRDLTLYSLGCGAGTKDVHIVPFLWEFHVLIMKVFKEGREDSSTCNSVMAPTTELSLCRNKTRSATHYYVSSSGTTATEFVVSSRERFTDEAVVDLQLRTCSCSAWQRHGYPCVHAIAAIRHEGGNLYDYCDERVTAAKYRETYSQPIYPLFETTST